MVDPLAMTIAANVATKVADTLTDQAQQVLAAIVRRLREKLRSRPLEVAALEATIATNDAPAVAELARQLDQLFAADLRFRDEIQALWDSAHADQSTTNIFHGKADKVIMMHDVNGDLTIN
jgi:DNA helicase IV